MSTVYLEHRDAHHVAGASSPSEANGSTQFLVLHPQFLGMAQQWGTDGPTTDRSFWYLTHCTIIIVVMIIIVEGYMMFRAIPPKWDECSTPPVGFRSRFRFKLGVQPMPRVHQFLVSAACTHRLCFIQHHTVAMTSGGVSFEMCGGGRVPDLEMCPVETTFPYFSPQKTEGFQ